MKLKIIQILILVAIPFWLAGQNSYEVVFKTDNHELFSHVFYENSERFTALLGTFSESEPCREVIYSFNKNDKNDTVRWPVNLVQDDTTLYVGTIIKDNTQNFIIAGNGYYFYNNDSILSSFHWIMKLDHDKNIIWKKMYNKLPAVKNLIYNNWLHVLLLKNGDFLYAEQLVRYNPVYEKMNLFMVFDADGDTIKTKLFSGNLGEEIQSLTYNYDSSALLFHVSGQPIPNCDYTDGALVLDTTNFDVIDGFCYQENTNWEMISGVFDAKLISNGDLIVAGDGTAGYPPGKYLSIFKYDTNYNLIKTAHLTDPDTAINPGWAENIAINKEGEICVTGSFDNALGEFPQQYCWVYVAKLDTGLNLMNERYFGGDASYDVYSITATDDGGIAVGGYRYDYLTNGENEGDAFLIKTDGNLWVNTSINNAIPIHSALVYPNPGNGIIHIRTTENGSVFRLYNLTGKQVLQTVIRGLITEKDVSQLTNGVYVWKLFKNNREIDRGKWIKF